MARKTIKKGEEIKDRTVVATTMYLAKVVRDHMENFHCEHLSDEQMAELNPIIRNAIGTALMAIELRRLAVGADEFVRMESSGIPGYWEKPVATYSFDNRGLVYYALKEVRE